MYLEAYSSIPHLGWGDFFFFLVTKLTILIFKYLSNVCDFNFIGFKEQTFLVYLKMKFLY